MSDTQLRDEIVTLLLASYETTANALAWTWYLLARHPDAAMRLHAEIDAVAWRRPPSARRRRARSAVTRAWSWRNRCGCTHQHGSSPGWRSKITTRGATSCRRFARRAQPLGRSPERARTFRTRSDSTPTGGAPAPQRPAAIFVFPVRRRIAWMHGRGVCVDGRGAAARRHRPAVALSTARRIAASRNASGLDADAEVRDSRAGGAQIVKSASCGTKPCVKRPRLRSLMRHSGRMATAPNLAIAEARRER